jgi:hypothetical protein
MPRRKRPFLEATTTCLLALLGTGILLAENVDPDADGSQYAYGENVGWLNAEPSGEGGPGVQVADDGLTGWMWGESLGWVSLSCQNTASCGTTDYVVTNDGAGSLGGYAWAENAGWISFSCETTSSCATASYGVTIDPVSGEFAGRAWGENVGWISFASDGPDPFRVKTAWTCPPVLGEPLLMLQKLGLDTELSWSGPNGATEHDVVRGDLGVLRSSGGDFSAATLDCTANDDPFGSTLFAPSPAPAQGFWFLARAADCGGGTYDSGGPSQVAPRDAGLDAAVNGCP